MTTCYDAFASFVQAIRAGRFIESETDKDKEFHFQNWVGARLEECGLAFDEVGRNTYPDFRLVEFPEGYEVKGLKSPGRIASYDANSQVPSGWHRKRQIFYVFGLYPKDLRPYPKDQNGRRKYPLQDLVVCHGDFLNADSAYVHRNKAIRAFGTYGDIMIRDRKMYVPPTPFALTLGTAGLRTLIVPESLAAEDNRYRIVGRLTRTEAQEMVVGYTFDLRTNELTPETIANPNAGKEHRFVAYRLKDDPDHPVSMRQEPLELGEDDEEAFAEDGE